MGWDKTKTTGIRIINELHYKKKAKSTKESFWYKKRFTPNK